eukprot:478440-Prorocentrum_minimum.AAC.1
MGTSGYITARGPITWEPAGIYLPGDQPHGSQRVYTCPGTNHRRASGYIPARRPTTWEPAGIYLPGDQPHGNQWVYTCPGTNHMGTSGYVPARGPITREGASGYIPARGPIKVLTRKRMVRRAGRREERGREMPKR